ncbi:MAG TPA: calcium-binding protein, partial [Azospirillum sp.]
MYGEGGNDTMNGGDGQDIMDGGDGHDRMDGEGGNDVMAGQNGDDTLAGWSGDDQLFGGAGRDRLEGAEGADRLFGENGDDSAWGGTGNDTAWGGGDQDTLHGEDGDDYLLGEDGYDLLGGGSGRDNLDGGNHGDTLQGDGDNDTLFGQAGDDKMWGGSGNDVMDGGDDGDVMFGESGNDDMAGQGGDDHLFGGDGDDRLYYTGGADGMNGEGDTDTLVLFGRAINSWTWAKYGETVVHMKWGDSDQAWTDNVEIFEFSDRVLGLKDLKAVIDSSRADPLVIDLDGDGIELLTVSASTVTFDINADGTAEQTGWVTGGDGFLALDRNGDGVINDASELFSEYFADGAANGLEALGTLDANGDGVFDATDEAFASVVVWNGDTASGESGGGLTALSTYDIASISLGGWWRDGTEVGANTIALSGSFTRADGGTGTIADVDFGYVTADGAEVDSAVAGEDEAEGVALDPLTGLPLAPEVAEDEETAPAEPAEV